MTARAVKGRVAAAVLLAASSAVSGCISLLPKTASAQLYQFDGRDPVPSPTPMGPTPSGPVAAVVLSQVTLPNAAQGDGILTVSGDQAAYLAGARWTSPAAVMFQEDVARTFQDGARHTRLIDRSSVGAADAVLRLDVSRFAARYDPTAPAAPPTVRLTVRATLTSPDGRRALQQVFDQTVPASQDRVGAVVAAYAQAVRQALSEVVVWTDQLAPTLRTPAAQLAGSGHE